MKPFLFTSFFILVTMHVKRWYLAHITAWWDHPMQCSVHYDLVSIDWMVTALGVPDADENGCIRKGLWVFIKMEERVRRQWKPKKKENWDRKQNEERKWKLYFITEFWYHTSLFILVQILYNPSEFHHVTECIMLMSTSFSETNCKTVDLVTNG